MICEIGAPFVHVLENIELNDIFGAQFVYISMKFKNNIMAFCDCRRNIKSSLHTIASSFIHNQNWSNYATNFCLIYLSTIFV